MLIFIGTTTMFWQEWFGDWAAYLRYNSHLALIPGYHLPLNSPIKPWAVIPAYAWFFCFAYTSLTRWVKRVHLRIVGTAPSSPAPVVEELPASQGSTLLAVRPVVEAPGSKIRVTVGSFAVLIGVSLVVHYLWDLVIEGVATQWGLWTYVKVFGPAISGPRGNFPLLYPVIFFALAMTITSLVVTATRPDGTPTVEALLRVGRLRGTPRTAARIGTWILTMNATYWFLFIGPIVLIRYAFLPHSALVP